MDTDAVVIDLGDNSARQHRPESRRRRRRAGRPQVPRWAALPLLPVLLVLLGGSAVPRPVLEQLWSLDPGVSSLSLSGSRTFVLRSPSRETTVITAYRSADGRRLWQAPVPEVVGWLQPMPGAGILLVFQGTGSVVALSTASGWVRWRLADLSLVDLQAGGRRTLAINQRAGSAGRLQLLDLSTGQPVWSQRIGAGTQVAAAQDGAGRRSIGWVVVQAPDGTTRIIDEASGRTLRTAKLPAPERGADTLLATGQLVLTLATRGTDTIITGYDPVTMDRRWQTTVASRGYAAACGPVICINGTRGLAALDPATGSVRWTAGDWNVNGLVGGDALVGGALVASGHSRVALIEAMSGRVHALPGLWWPISYPSATLFAGSEPGRFGAWLGVLDDETGTIRSVGWLPDVISDRCQANAPEQTYLACSTTNGQTQLWRYRPAGA